MASATAMAIKAKRTFSDEAILGGSPGLWGFEGELVESSMPVSASRGREFAGNMLVSCCETWSFSLAASTCLLASWRWGCCCVVTC